MWNNIGRYRALIKEIPSNMVKYQVFFQEFSIISWIKRINERSLYSCAAGGARFLIWRFLFSLRRIYAELGNRGDVLWWTHISSSFRYPSSVNKETAIFLLLICHNYISSMLLSVPTIARAFAIMVELKL